MIIQIYICDAYDKVRASANFLFKSDSKKCAPFLFYGN